MGEESIFAQIETLLRAGVRSGEFPGCVAGWLTARTSDQSTLAVGERKVGPGHASADEGTMYDLASLTKPLVVTSLFLLARRRGLVGLSSTVGSVFGKASRQWATLTVHQLLTHTGGVPAWVPLYALADEPKSAETAVFDLEPIGPPGGQVVYSCPGFILLGWMLERLADMSLAEAFTAWVTKPLGLETDLTFTPPEADSRLAGGAINPTAELRLLADMGFEGAFPPPWRPGLPDDGNARFLGGVAGNAGLFGTIGGVLQIGRQFIVGRGVLFDAEELEIALSRHTEELLLPRALGWQLASSPGCSAGPGLDPLSIGHTGFTGTSLWIDPRREIVVALLANRHHPGHRAVDLHPLRRRLHRLVASA